MSDLIAYVIEDDKNLSLAYAEAVEDAGFVSEIYRNGTEALDRLKVTTPNLIILDLNLPGVHGLDILKYIRQEERLKHIRVIVTTASDRAAETLYEKADLVLVKPVGYGQLRDMAKRFHKPPTGPLNPS